MFNDKSVDVMYNCMQKSGMSREQEFFLVHHPPKNISCWFLLPELDHMFSKWKCSNLEILNYNAICALSNSCSKRLVFMMF